ncbi:MAG: type II secretion system F family protein, partial [Bacillota bacterium]
MMALLKQITPYDRVMLALVGATGMAIAVPIVISLTTLLNKMADVLSQNKLLTGMKSLLVSDRERADIPLAVKRALRLSQKDQELPEWARGWMNQVEHRLKKSGVTVPVGRYVLGMFLGACLGVVVGGVILRNPVAAIILGAAAFLVPDVILVGRIQKRRFKIIDQLGAAVRIFAAEFKDTPQVPRALSNTAKRIPVPLGEVLSRSSRELAAGTDKDEVLSNMMADLDF